MKEPTVGHHVRGIIAATAALAVCSFGAKAAPVDEGPLIAKPDYSAKSAGLDAASRAILAQACVTMDCQTLKQERTHIDAHAIHLQFAQIIAQNFAQMNSAHVTAMIDQYSQVRPGADTTELEDIATYYDLSVADRGVDPGLMDVLSARLDSAHMATVQAAFAGAALRRPQGQWLDYTPYEIYLDLRTAPIGALSVPAALLQTGLYVGTQLYMSYQAGYSAGTLLNDVIVKYDPALEDDIGEYIYDSVNWITTQGSLWWNYGKAQQSLGQTFSYDNWLSQSYLGAIEENADLGSAIGWDLGFDENWGGHGGSCYPYTCMMY
jgi:hypothetical protein